MTFSTRTILIMLTLLLIIGGAIWIFFDSQAYLQPQPEACDAQATRLSISVSVNRAQPPNTFDDNTVTTLPPIDVQVGDTVNLVAEINPQPAGCIGTFSIDWETVDGGFDLQSMKTVTESPLREQLQLQLGSHDPRYVSPDTIFMVVRDASGTRIRSIELLLQEKAS